MLTSKQRAQLRKLANPIDTLIQIGKDGITDGVIAQIDETLEKRELIKIRLLETAFLTPREAASELSAALKAEPVQCIGTKVVLYRQSRDKDNRKIILEK